MWNVSSISPTPRPSHTPSLAACACACAWGVPPSSVCLCLLSTFVWVWVLPFCVCVVLHPRSCLFLSVCTLTHILFILVPSAQWAELWDTTQPYLVSKSPANMMKIPFLHSTLDAAGATRHVVVIKVRYWYYEGAG